MVDPSTYRVIVRARDNGTGYTYLITCTDDPVWSQGTNVFYPSPETVGVSLNKATMTRPWSRDADYAYWHYGGPINLQGDCARTG